MVKNLLIDKLKNLEQEHRDIDEVLIQLQEKQTIDLLPEQAVPIIVDYLINLGRDVRSALIIKTNKGLKKNYVRINVNRKNG